MKKMYRIFAALLVALFSTSMLVSCGGSGPRETKSWGYAKS